MMMKKWTVLLSTLVILCLMVSGTAFAFQDVDNQANSEKILSMKERGLINGLNDTTFNPNGVMTFAQGIQFIVKGFGLNIDHIRFIKEPKASDYYAHVEDQAWYADAFIIAQFNLDMPSDIKPNEPMTREQFAHYLSQAISTKGDFPLIQIYVMIEDEADVTPDYMNAIQKLLITKVTELDDNGRFNPQETITRSEAAVMIYNALEYVDHMLSNVIIPIDPDVSLDVENVTDEVYQVTVSWGEQPHPGYGISVDRIEFNEDNTANIVYSLHYPDPDRMYPQVIVYPKAVVYLGSEYTPVLKPNPDQSVSNSLLPGHADGSGGGSSVSSEPIEPVMPIEQ